MDVPTTERAVTLVWIDSREAILLRWIEGAALEERIASDVPVHHRSTGNVRHRPDIRHGGGGPPQTAGEPHRLEHLSRFLNAVIERLKHDDALIVLGPGNVHERLAQRLRALDASHRAKRHIHVARAPRMTDAELVAQLRRVLGHEPRRRTVGAYRWSPDRADRPSHRPTPWRVVPKRLHGCEPAPEE